jgi:carbonic anhydrase
MDHLISIPSPDEIPSAYRDTPIGLLLEYHNLQRPLDSYQQAQLLIGMCMDNRKSLRIPDNFAYIIRAGGANLRYSEFKVSYAIAVGGVKCIALIGHNNCGMVNLASKRDSFIEGLVENAGWSRASAEEHFRHFAPMFEIGDEVDFVSSEAKRLRINYPKILIAPMLYLVENNLLYLIRES